MKERKRENDLWSIQLHLLIMALIDLIHSFPANEWIWNTNFDPKLFVFPFPVFVPKVSDIGRKFQKW